MMTVLCNREFDALVFRLYLASIHRDLTEEDIRSVFSAFGTIKDCDMAKYAQHLIYTSIGVK